MIKRFGRLSVGALFAALLFSHISVAKAEMGTGKFIQLIESEGKVSAELTKEFVMKGFLASTYVGLRWANLMLSNLKRQPLFCLPADKSPTADEHYKLLKDFVKLDPNIEGEPAGSVLLRGYMLIYPCR